MPVYEYKGLTAGNRTTRGMVNATTARAARLKLREDGIFPTSISEGKTRSAASELLSRFKLPDLRRVPDLDLSVFTSQLSTFLEAGIPLVESLGSLTEQIENGRLKSIVGRIRESVNHGASLADAMAEHSQVFDQLYCAMVSAGESAGALELVLKRLADYVEDRRTLRSKILTAMTYPIFMVSMILVAAGVLVVYVLPQIADLLRDLEVELPLLTRIVLALSDFVAQWWTVLLVSPLILFLVMNRFIQTEGGRYLWDRFKLSSPVIGRITRYVSISRFTRTLSTLLSGGLNIVLALDIAKKVAANVIIGAAVEDAKEAITKGASIAGPLRQSGEFPPMVTHMVSVGEASGRLDAMLAKVSDTYDVLVDNSINRFTALLGPILLLIVAALVVMLISATLLPLLNLTSAL